jgi:hypothetical protein
MGYFPGIKRLQREVDHLHPPSAEVNCECSYTSTPTTCLHGVERDNLQIFKRLVLLSYLGEDEEREETAEMVPTETAIFRSLRLLPFEIQSFPRLITV